MSVVMIIAGYFIFMNILGFFLMGLDKHKAQKKVWRIPEATLFTTAIFGGSLGTTLGLFLFHHKTRHWYFLYGMPFILFLQLLLFYIIAHSPVTITIL